MARDQLENSLQKAEAVLRRRRTGRTLSHEMLYGISPDDFSGQARALQDAAALSPMPANA
jgi:hypothetical protein